MALHKEHGQVTGVIWRGPADLATYERLKEYATKHNLSVSAAAKQILTQTLNAINK
ncbi:MAG: hypothetical protein ACI31K_02360 [Limosilactobacillus reuteri]